MPADFAIEAGRVVCPASGFDAPGIVRVSGQTIESVTAPDAAHPAAGQTFRFPDGILLPGLIDLHAHPAKSGSVFGVAPDEHMLPRGVTTVLSQGDAGADTIDEYVAETIETSRTRVLLAINLSRIGESTNAGCFENLDDAEVDACVTAVERHCQHIPMIAVNLSHHACGPTDPRAVLVRGIEAATRTGLPILLGLRRPSDWALNDQLRRLRAGDVVTYCFRQEPHCIVENDRVLACVREARDRGVLFDVGHGMASFSFNVAEAAIADGFLPDSISTDLQSRHLSTHPTQHDLPLVMSKLAAAGMSDDAIFAAVTSKPGACLRDHGTPGTLKRGALADLVVLQQSDIESLPDAHGREKPGRRWSAVFGIKAGQPVDAGRE